MLRSLKIITHIYSVSAGEKTSRNWSPISVPSGLVAFRNENITNCFHHWLPLILYCMFLVKTLFDVTCSSLCKKRLFPSLKEMELIIKSECQWNAMGTGSSM